MFAAVFWWQVGFVGAGVAFLGVVGLMVVVVVVTVRSMGAVFG